MDVDRKPNLYLYPEKKTKMTVSMEFPHGGKVIESIPAYPEKWDMIKVKPNGKIDKKYDYLFYECEIPIFGNITKAGLSSKTNCRHSLNKISKITDLMMPRSKIFWNFGFRN